MKNVNVSAFFAVDQTAMQSRARHDGRDFVWDDATNEKLRQLWADGLSAAAIARQLGCTKNSVVSKAHRLHLTARPSPIIRREAGHVPAPKPKAQTRQKIVRVRPHAAQRPRTLTHAKYTPVSTEKYCFPIGEPGRPEFHFCGEFAKWAKPYCPAHCEIAYVNFGAQELYRGQC